MRDSYWVYLMMNGGGTTLYTGMTSDLPGRVYQHKAGTFKGFTSRYHAEKLVYFEEYGEVTQAIAREKQIKKWRREKKDALVMRMNPGLRDLSEDF